MPDNYFRATEVSEVVKHLRLFRTFLENVCALDGRPLTPAVNWEPFPEQGHTIVSLYNWGRQQLLAKIAGSFAGAGINILSVDTFTRGDHTVLDIFRVCDINARAVTAEPDYAAVAAILCDALENETFDFSPLLEKARRQARPGPRQELDFPTYIAVDNKAHPAYTLIQIQTPDRVALLYDLLSCFGREGVSIALSRISTQNGAAIDTFYGTDSGTGSKITDSNRIAVLQERLHSATVSGT